LVIPKKKFVIWSDKGPDWNTDFPTNFFLYGRFFKTLHDNYNIEDLMIVTLCGGASKYNSIELFWGYLSKIFAGKIFG
jgi:hypothetical protein